MLERHMFVDEAWQQYLAGRRFWTKWMMAALNGKVSYGSNEEDQMIDAAVAFGWCLGSTGMGFEKCRAYLRRLRSEEIDANARRHRAAAKRKRTEAAKADQAPSVFDGRP